MLYEDDGVADGAYVFGLLSLYSVMCFSLNALGMVVESLSPNLSRTSSFDDLLRLLKYGFVGRLVGVGEGPQCLL